MNAEKVQNIINKIVDDYRSSAYKGGRNQYPASKKYIARAEELGILEFIPNAYGSREPGNTEIQLILEAAEDAGGTTGGFNEYGEGDVTDTKPSALYKAIHEVEETKSNESVKVGSKIRVAKQDRYFDLAAGAIHETMWTKTIREHETTVVQVLVDELIEYDPITDTETPANQYSVLTKSGYEVPIETVTLISE
jgi:hypothetical protein